MSAAKKLNAKEALKAKVAALKSKKAEKSNPKEEKTVAKKNDAKVLDLKSKLKKKGGKSEVSVITNVKEREKLARYGIEAVVVNDPDIGEQVGEVRVDKDLVVITLAERADVVEVAMGLYKHIKAQATKLAEAMKDE